MYILGLTPYVMTPYVTYKCFIEGDGMNDEIRKVTATGRPLGSISFIEKMEKMTGRHLRPKKGGRPKKSR